MSILISIIVTISSIILGKFLFRKWFNHLSLYAFSWGIFIILFELRLMHYTPVKGETWVIIISTFVFFLFGIFTLLSVRFYSCGSGNPYIEGAEKNIWLFNDKGKKVRIFLLVFTIIGFVTALQQWYILINKFGSIPAVLVSANLIYRLRVEGEITGTIPYLNSFSYAAVFLGGLYTAYKGRLTILAILPLLVVILQDMASVGRAGIFLAFMEFIITFILFRHFLSYISKEFTIKKINMTFAVLIILTLFVFSTTFIRISRGSNENYKISTQTLKNLEKSSVISPSIYFYFSSNIAVLSKYFEKGGENKMFGENTFLPVYNFFSKFDFVEHPSFYPKGYFIPVWTNSATYIRELHEDFGFWGVFIFPYMLGFVSTLYWFKFYEKNNLIDFIILVYIFLIIAFSTFYLITRAAVWVLSLFILIILFRILKNSEIRKT
ncbi:MAG: O-antigen polymerase [Ignavibacteriaceae bacterium]